MRNWISLAALAAVVTLLAGCMGPPEGVVNMANRSYMSYAMGKPYTKIANAHPTTMEGLAGETAYGPMIGSFKLADGNTVYRHIAVGATAESGTDFGLVGSSKTKSLYRLAYFRVGPDGIVNDWATGSVEGGQTACRYYVGGIFQNCTDVQARTQSFEVYDSLVRTSSKAPLSSWGPRAEMPVPAPQPQG